MATLRPDSSGFMANRFSFAVPRLPDGDYVLAVWLRTTDADGNPVKAWGNFDPASVTVYLIRLRDQYGWRFKIGPMKTDKRGVWTVAFRVPKVRAGLYTTAFFCRPCGNTFFASTLPDDQWTPEPSRVLKVRRSARR